MCHLFWSIETRGVRATFRCLIDSIPSWQHGVFRILLMPPLQASVIEIVIAQHLVQGYLRNPRSFYCPDPKIYVWLFLIALICSGTKFIHGHWTIFIDNAFQFHLKLHSRVWKIHLIFLQLTLSLGNIIFMLGLRMTVWVTPC